MAQANVVNTLIVPAASKVAPYYDDFDESKNFHRVMFRPGYAVQARELTQLQTILQNQIERFGRHVFVNGSPVIGGKMDVTDVVTLNLQPQYANVDIDVTAFKDKTITYSSGNNEVIARVVQTSPATNTAPPAIHVKYLSGTEFSNGATILASNTQLYANIATTANAVSNGSIAFIYDSIYFMQGFFVKAQSQTVVISKHIRQANVKVGLELTDEIITEYNDATLLDPAQESSNYQAPGAGRYQVKLNLRTRELDSIDDEKWIQVAILRNGIIREINDKPIYSEIEEVLARRTYDESGNYIVRPFNLKVENSNVDPANNYMLSISPGKAYVYGFEAENQSTTEITIPAARQTKSVSNYPLRINFGNYVIVDGLKGTFNTSGQGIIDLHCVDAPNVSISNTNTYNASKVGTARIRDLNFYGGGSDAANVLSRQYELYFYDQNFRVITDNATATTANTQQITINTQNTSAVPDAYTGAYIKIIAGPASGDLRLITGYNGSTKVANVDVAFSAATTTASKYEIRFDITDVDSFYQTTLYTGAASSNAYATIHTSNKDNGSLTGNTFISEPTFTDGVFPFPQAFVAPGIGNTSYIYRRVYNSVNFTSGNATLTSATTETFEGDTTTSNVSSTIMDNFLVVVTNPTGSARTVGDQVKVTANVSSTTPQTARLQTGNTTESFTATVYSKMLLSDAAPRVKTLVKANTLVFSSGSATTTINNSATSNTDIYLSTGQVVIQNPRATESLYISDVIDVVKVYQSEVYPTAGQPLISLRDVTSQYTVDRGQKSQFYDYASIKLKPGFQNPKGYIIACVRYYSSTTDSGFFSVDSYPSLSTMIEESTLNIGTGYAITPDVNGVKMTDIIDFRPVRPNASNNQNFSFASARTPIATTNFTTDYSYYLDRRDIVVMTVNDELKLIQGLPESKSFPATPARSLLLHRLKVLPYTLTRNDIFVETLDHRRYTMSDIGKIDRRLKSVEYNTTLNSLERSADNTVIRDVDGLDRTKYAILAEDFSSHLLADKDAADYSCAVDINGTFSPTGGVLMPRVMTNYIPLQANSATASGLSVFDDKIMLAFKTTPAISQTSATKAAPVVEHLFSTFRGHIVTNPEQDIWKDTTVLPTEVISLPKPVIKFDIQAYDITNITNNDYTDITNITNVTNITEEINTTIINDIKNITEVTNITEVSEPPPIGVDKVLPIVAPGEFPDYFGILRWKKTGALAWPGDSGNFVEAPEGVIQKLWADGYFYGDYGNGTPEKAPDGVRTAVVGMSNRQMYALVRKTYDRSGFPLLSGQLGISDSLIELVYDMYDETLNRPPDLPGMLYWIAISRIHGWSEQKTRQEITQAATQNTELSSGFDPTTTMDLTPKYVMTAEQSVKLVGGDIKVRFTDEFGNYETSKTPDGRTVLAPRTAETMIIEYYNTYLGRPPDAGGLEYWTSIYNQKVAEFGGADSATARERAGRFVEEGFLTSSERRNALGGNDFNSSYVSENVVYP